MVNLELTSALMKKKGSGTQAAKTKAATKKKEDSMDKTKGRKKMQHSQSQTKQARKRTRKR